MHRFQATLLSAALVFLTCSLAGAQEWNIQLVDDAGSIGYQSQIVVTSDGTPYIVYANSNNTLFLAWWVDEGSARGWNYQAISTVRAYSKGMEVLVDADDRLHLCWTGGANPYPERYGIYDPAIGDWVLGPEAATPSSYVTSHTDMVLMQDGDDLIPLIVYNEDNTSPKITRRDPGSGTWSQEIISEVHHAYGQSSIAVDAHGGIHVCFYEPTGDNLMYAYQVAGGAVWALQTIDTDGNVGQYSQIVVDDDDNIFIAYYDVTNGDLKSAVSVIP